MDAAGTGNYWPTIFLFVGLVILLFRRRLSDLLGVIKQIRYKDFSAEFDRTAQTAFETAAEKVWKRPAEDRQEYLTDPDFYFTDADFASAKTLRDMMPPRLWMPIRQLRVQSNTRTLIYDLADQYRKIRAESPSSDRTKRMSSVVARMRILTFAAYPLLPDLMAGSAGERLAAIAFLQVRSCYSAVAIKWLAKRISPNEEKLVQYHAAGALLHACRRAEQADLEALDQAIVDAKAVCEKADRIRISERALELLQWSKYSLDAKPFSHANVPERPQSPSA